ncbi:MAG TPA: PP2C family serine/threonine-protein phosphatase, partial [Polyangiaceae bacterium]|nr:PP2C family serine/threonine-protein phosphatase [Polyangiaceae bacterium]
EIAVALARQETPQQIATRLLDLANAAGGPDNIAVLVLSCQGGHARGLATDSAPAPAPPPATADLDADHSDPELLILGIEDLDLAEGKESASDGLFKALDDLLVSPPRK